MMDNGFKVLKMDKELIMIQLQRQYMKVNGKMERKMVLVFSNFLKNNIIKEPLLNQLKMDMELKFSLMEINIKVNIEKENSMEKVNILGLILQFLKVISIKV